MYCHHRSGERAEERGGEMVRTASSKAEIAATAAHGNYKSQAQFFKMSTIDLEGVSKSYGHP